VRPLEIVVVDPVGDLDAGVVEIEEQGLVEQFVTHPAIEAFSEAVLHRLARCDEMPVDGSVLTPDEHGIAGELGAVVGHDHSWLAALLDDRRQLAGNASARDGCVRNGAQTFLGYVIDNVNAQLIDAETSNHLWAELFDKPVAYLFDMQDEIVSRLANALDAELIAAEARRAERSSRPDAMDLVFQGRAWYNKGLTPDHMARARDFFEWAWHSIPKTSRQWSVERWSMFKLVPPL